MEAMRLLKAIYRLVIKRAACGALVGKNRSRSRAEGGRFSARDVKAIVAEAWRNAERRASNLPEQPTFGSRMNLMLACLCFSMLEGLVSRGVERQYAVELIADAAWKVYRKWAIVPMFLARHLTRDPTERMKICVNAFLRFPFNPPGYQLERIPSDRGVTFNIIACPIARYFRQQGAADLCIASWCNLDFALAQMWGGKLERTGTLADGGICCDFHFEAASATR